MKKLSALQFAAMLLTLIVIASLSGSNIVKTQRITKLEEVNKDLAMMIDPSIDMDGDGIPNGADYDTDGDGLCNTGGVARDANPGKAISVCSGEDTNDDNDKLADSEDSNPTDPSLPICNWVNGQFICTDGQPQVLRPTP